MAQLIIETRTDLINYPYALVLDIWDIQPITKPKKRRIRLNNIYDNSSKEISHKGFIALIFYNGYIYIDLYSKI
jgi:hypothetical protein